MKNNKVIAEFMGMEHCYRPYGDGFMEVKENGSCVELKDLQYHKSWDWLIPVIEKCRRRNNEVNVIPGKGYKYAINSFDNDFNIDFSYKAVVKFIKLYNQVL